MADVSERKANRQSKNRLKWKRRREAIQAMANKWRVPVPVAVQILAGRIGEQEIPVLGELDQWRTEYAAEQAAQRAGGKAADDLKHRQAEQISKTLRITQQAAFCILKGVTSPKPSLAQPVPRWLELCRTYQIPAGVAAQILAGLIDEAQLDGHPQREQWAREFEAQSPEGTQAAKRLLAKDVAKALRLTTRRGSPDVATATAVLNGTTAARTAWILAKQREEFEALERQREQSVAQLQACGVPKGMAAIVAQRSPADPAGEWERLVQASGFASAHELIAAWQESGAWTAAQLVRNKERQQRGKNAGLLPAELAALCAPDRIERSLELVYHLNHWAKARDRLLHEDRQKLYKVKARILQQSFSNGLLQASVRVDASQSFAPFEKWMESGIEVAVEWLADLLDQSFEHGDWSGDGWGPFYPLARQLYYRATGQEITAADAEAFSPKGETAESVRAYIRRRLQQLQDEARATRRPVPVSELKALLLSPDDIPAIACDSEGDSRWRRFTPGWDELDAGDLGPLDPEWFSLVGFRYESATARYGFHLPLRVAEKFIPADELQRLTVGLAERESGEYFGREITEEESLEHPIEEVLEKLGVDADVVCPRGLVDKQDYVAQVQAQRATYARYFWDDDDDDDDGDWDERGDYSGQSTCPRCGKLFDADTPARLEHWRLAHSDISHVIVGEAFWIFVAVKSLAKQATARLAPAGKRGKADVWPLASLEEFIAARKVERGESEHGNRASE